MKFNRSSTKPSVLSEHEKSALRAIANGAVIEPLLCERLKALGLVKQSRHGWVITHQGHIRLMFRGAR
jgi:ribosomal protein S19E (S16A)